MRHVILSMMVTLDGSMAGPGGDLNWFRTDREFEDDMLALLRRVDTMLFGRASYELLAQDRPLAATEREPAGGPDDFTSRERKAEFAELMNRTAKVVYSRTLTSASWGPVRIVRDAIAEDLASMRERAGADIVLFAGGDIASAFVNLDLFDEYRLMIHPCVIGGGRPLFRNLTASRDVILTRTRAFPSGVVLVEYARRRSALQCSPI